MNGIRTHKSGNTIFIPMPKEQHRPIDGGCSCGYCKEHPDSVPAWDTLAVSAIPNDGWTWTVHYPEIH